MQPSWFIGMWRGCESIRPFRAGLFLILFSANGFWPLFPHFLELFRGGAGSWLFSLHHVFYFWIFQFFNFQVFNSKTHTPSVSISVLTQALNPWSFFTVAFPTIMFGLLSSTSHTFQGVIFRDKFCNIPPKVFLLHLVLP